MPLIPDEDWNQFFHAPMCRLLQEEEPPFDFWNYVETIPTKDFQGYDCSEGKIEYVYRDNSGRFEHVLINSTRRDVVMVIVLDRFAGSVAGHKLLDLPRRYGTDMSGTEI